MRHFYKFLMATAMLMAPYAQAGLNQKVIEAEQVAGGTITQEMQTSGGSSVTRSSGGIYVWWVTSTADLTPGTYSFYARIALASGVSTSQSFTANIYYNEQLIGSPSLSVSNKHYRWMRVGSFELSQVGASLRIADWSPAGMKVDKIAIVKDVLSQAESTPGGTVINDASALGGQAVTRTTAGIYTWWNVNTSDLKPGDYEVHIRLRSSDGAGHNHTGVVTLDGVNQPTTSAVISSTAYQWVKFNDFTYSGGTQTLRISDYSAPSLRIDAIRLVRRTPYDTHAGAQILFAAGSDAHMYQQPEPDEILFTFSNGAPNNGRGKFVNEGRVSVVQKDHDTYLIYFRQSYPYGTNEVFQIFMGKSTDGGKTFDVAREPIITWNAPVNVNGAYRGTLTTAYDPAVTRYNGKYYMVFEGSGAGCWFSAYTAESTDGETGWTVTNIPVCSLFTPSQTNQLGSVSTPTYYIDPQTNTQYIQWVSADVLHQKTRHFQATLPNGPSSGTLTFGDSNVAAMEAYVMPQGQTAADAWEVNNFGAGNVYYEDGYYYLAYEGADSYGCNPIGGTSRWGLGIIRTSTPGVLSSWTRSPKNPYMLSPSDGSCWLEYPQLVTLPSGVFLYYSDFLKYWAPDYGGDTNTRTTFRKRIMLP